MQNLICKLTTDHCLFVSQGLKSDDVKSKKWLLELASSLKTTNGNGNSSGSKTLLVDSIEQLTDFMSQLNKNDMATLPWPVIPHMLKEQEFWLAYLSDTAGYSLEDLLDTAVTEFEEHCALARDTLILEGLPEVATSKKISSGIKALRDAYSGGSGKITDILSVMKEIHQGTHGVIQANKNSIGTSLVVHEYYEEMFWIQLIEEQLSLAKVRR